MRSLTGAALHRGHPHQHGVKVDGSLPFLELTLVEMIQAAGGQAATQVCRSVSRLQLSQAVDRALDALVEAT